VSERRTWDETLASLQAMEGLSVQASMNVAAIDESGNRMAFAAEMRRHPYRHRHLPSRRTPESARVVADLRRVQSVVRFLRDVKEGAMPLDAPGRSPPR